MVRFNNISTPQINTVTTTTNSSISASDNKKPYTVQKGDGLMKVAREVIHGNVHINQETLAALLIKNKIDPNSIGSNMVLEVGMQFNHIDVPQKINDLTVLGYKFMAYCVQTNDTFSNIAEDFTGNYANAEMLSKLNNIKTIKPGDMLYIPIQSNMSWGNRIQIPDYTTYKVEPGDNPQKIAEKITGNYANSDQIMQFNNVTENLKIGQKLIIPKLNGEKLYIVQPKDNFNTIIAKRAATLGLTTETEISALYDKTLQLSNINNPTALNIGQIIYFPKPNNTNAKTEKLTEENKQVIKQTIKSKKNQTITPPTLTLGVTTNSKTWKAMNEELSSINATQLSLKQKAEIYDLAHLLYKEVLVTKSDWESTEKRDIRHKEMQLVTLSVLNRKTVCAKKPNYRSMWGSPSIKGIILKPFQYSSFNMQNAAGERNSKNVKTIEKDYSEKKWKMCINAAAKIYQGDLSDIEAMDPGNKRGLKYITNYYNPSICNPSWAKEEYGEKNPRARYVRVSFDGAKHLFYREDSSMKGYQALAPKK